MAVNFSNLLNKPTDNVARPVTLEDGTYFGTVQSHTFGESSSKKTPFVEYTIVLTHAHEDTDVGDIPAEKIVGKKMRTPFYLTDESMYRLVDFIGTLGVTTAGRTVGELIPQATGQTVMLDVIKKPSADGESYFNEVKKVVGLNQPEPAEEEQVAEAQGRRRRG